MSHFLIAFIFAVGFGGWIYAKLGRRTGGSNQRDALIGAVVGAVLGFVVLLTVLNMIA